MISESIEKLQPNVASRDVPSQREAFEGGNVCVHVASGSRKPIVRDYSARDESHSFFDEGEGCEESFLEKGRSPKRSQRDPGGGKRDYVNSDVAAWIRQGSDPEGMLDRLKTIGLLREGNDGL